MAEWYLGIDPPNALAAVGQRGGVVWATQPKRSPDYRKRIELLVAELEGKIPQGDILRLGVMEAAGSLHPEMSWDTLYRLGYWAGRLEAAVEARYPELEMREVHPQEARKALLAGCGARTRDEWKAAAMMYARTVFRVEPPNDDVADAIVQACYARALDSQAGQAAVSAGTMGRGPFANLGGHKRTRRK